MTLNRPGDRLWAQILSAPARRLRATRPMERRAAFRSSLQAIASAVTSLARPDRREHR